MTERSIGLIGLGPMGTGLAENLLRNGFSVAAWDRDFSATMEGSVRDEVAGISLHRSLADLAAAVEPPRRMILSIRGGPPVDAVIEQILPFLSPGDIVADCGNSHFLDTARRGQLLDAGDVGYLGVGVSGGPDGAKEGPSIMAGGSTESWQGFRDAFEAIAAKADGTPCGGHVGQDGAGHFVKMVHNGIEYAVMHLLMEMFEILKRCFGQDQRRLAEVIAEMNNGLTAGYLTEITAAVVAEPVPGEATPLIDVVADAVGQKGTGRWSLIAALDQGVAVPTIAEAVMYRLLSASPDRGVLPWSQSAGDPARLDGVRAMLPDAMTCALISTFAQGLSIFDTCEASLGHPVDQREILRIWRGGCILKGQMVDFLWHSAESEATPENMLSWEPVRTAAEQSLAAMRETVAKSTAAGIPCPGFSSALAYLESRLRAPLPTALLQLQRDYFGRHGLQDKRTGKPISVAWKGTAGQP